MTTRTAPFGVEALLAALKVLNSVADHRTSYTARGEEVVDFRPLAAKLLIADAKANGDQVVLPEEVAVERVEEQLTQLFLNAHILSRVYTCLDS